MNKILFIVLSFVLLALSFAIYFTLTTPKKTEKFEDPKLKVMLFYATWCPHCERYLASGKYDEISRLSEKYSGVIFEKYDYDKNKSLGDKYNISSFPSIIAVDTQGKVYRFHGDRMKVAHMDIFVKQALAQKEVEESNYS